MGAQAGSLMATMTTDEFETALSKALECTDAATALGNKIRGLPAGVELLTNIIETNHM